MCGAIAIDYKPSLKKALSEFYTDQEINRFEQKGEIVFAYWDKHPVLPVKNKAGIELKEWGNRDAHLKIPKTGWARLESLLEKKWDHLKPKVVLIPAKRGCEKKHWFDLDKDIKAVLIQKNGVQRVYMITEVASDEFLSLIHI